MKLEEKHKEFVVKHFAKFMKLTDLVEAFMEKFAEDLPPPDFAEAISVEDFFEDLLNEDGIEGKQEFIEQFIEKHTEEFRKTYGDKADQKLNEQALEEYERDRKTEAVNLHHLSKTHAKEDTEYHRKELQQNLFNRFRRLNIDHPQFPNKYRTLFKETRDAYCENYRSQALNNPESLARELETLYGYHKQLIFQLDDPKEISKCLNSAHQILKTVLAHNALNASQQVADITPQNVKTPADSQKALTKMLKENS